MIIEDKEKIISDLAIQLERIFSYVKTDENFFASIAKQYNKHKDYYKNLEDCYFQNINSYKKVIERYKYHNEFSHINDILLERGIWTFIENNPEQWYVMIEKIAYDDQCANVLTPSGFYFTNYFINHSIYNEGSLEYFQKDKEIIFFHVDNHKERDYYIKFGYSVGILTKQSIATLLDGL